MKITPHNKDAAIEMLRARAFLFMMSGECRGDGGPLGDALWDLVGDMTEREAKDAIAAFQQTQ